MAIAADPYFALACAGPGSRTYSEGSRSRRSQRDRAGAQPRLRAVAGHPRTDGQSTRRRLAHIDRWPRDIVILSMPLGAFGLFAFSGMADHDQARVDLCERHAKHFDADGWWFLTYRGWTHGENGDVRLGRALTQRALQLRRHNVNAAHAVAYVLYESGANDEAQDMITGWLPEYTRRACFTAALHGIALIALERADTGRALATYNEHVAPAASLGTPINIVSDTSSFLWRMQAYGHAVPAGMWDDAASTRQITSRKGLSVR
ncbi:hypothetical protein QEN71_39780 (plasmid) [Paraburkholderia sabiae]|uniref:Sel1 repeat family protein n=1 Tax=Paraburkholderia sabiae TaxID=273251 RepID=A0ABU9QSD9_9BURK|nr:hypothetical protein [Paraburkholderia sabiae]WJZ79485.1 hypothetical protein QEN71_39780 [Paraburkholderia sabiae]